jgi:homocysteine S-methyltransferase
VGSVGPLGLVLEPLGPTSTAEAEGFFAEIVKSLTEAGVDGLSFETFHDLKELEAALRAARKITQVPMLAMISVSENFKTSYGSGLKEFVKQIGPLADVLGLNCQLGPSDLFDALEELRPLTTKPIAVFPNAGLPRYVNDRYIYLCNPDYLGKFSKRFVQAGATIIGGCCGTNDGHIRAIANSLRMAQSQKAILPKRARVETTAGGEPREPESWEKRSRLGETLAAKKPVMTVEINPPKGVSLQSFLKLCKELEDGGITFVNIPDGARAVSRMSSLHLGALVQRETKLEPIPHFTTRDRNLIGLQADLLGAHANGVRNVLLVTGDPPKLGNCPDATAVYDVDAIGLTHIVDGMNRGLDLGGSPFGEPTKYMIGVALNPTSINPQLEMQRLTYKMEAGADYAITQPIYDLEAYQRFFDSNGGYPKDFPIIMGIWPLVSLRNAEFLKFEVPGVSVPDWVIREMERAGDSQEEALKRGLDIALRTMSEAKSSVAGFQVSAPFNKVHVALQLIHAFQS